MRLMFPSPTGVNYYELLKAYANSVKDLRSFRPQQGLIIMNQRFLYLGSSICCCFRPQQGLIIMNSKKKLEQ